MKNKFLLLFILITMIGFAHSTFAAAQQPQQNNKLLELKAKLEALKQKRQQRMMPVTQPTPTPVTGPVDLPISSRSFFNRHFRVRTHECPSLQSYRLAGFIQKNSRLWRTVWRACELEQ
jgi:hypothetical protein